MCDDRFLACTAGLHHPGMSRWTGRQHRMDRRAALQPPGQHSHPAGLSTTSRSPPHPAAAVHHLQPAASPSRRLLAACRQWRGGRRDHLQSCVTSTFYNV